MAFRLRTAEALGHSAVITKIEFPRLISITGRSERATHLDTCFQGDKGHNEGQNGRLTHGSVECPVCATRNSDAASLCANCHTPLPELDPRETLNDAGTLVEDWSVASASKAAKSPVPLFKAGADQLLPGTVASSSRLRWLVN
jgi:hypothetical protein